MLKLSQLKQELFAFFRLMITTDVYLDVAYKGRLYRLHVEDLSKDVPYKKRHKKKRSLKSQIVKEKCPTCGGLLVNGVCFSSKHLNRRISDSNNPDQ